MSIGLRIALFSALFVAFTARGHHSIVVHYDPDDVRAITGTLQSLKWVNPHTEWVLEVADAQGGVQTWRAEGGAVNTLARNGLSRDLFRIGNSVTLIGPVARSGRTEMIAAQAVVAGTEYGIFPALLDELEEDLRQYRR